MKESQLLKLIEQLVIKQIKKSSAIKYVIAEEVEKQLTLISENLSKPKSPTIAKKSLRSKLEETMNSQILTAEYGNGEVAPVSFSELPDHLQGAFTKDYSKILKLANDKSKNRAM